MNKFYDQIIWEKNQRIATLEGELTRTRTTLIILLRSYGPQFSPGHERMVRELIIEASEVHDARTTT